MLILRSKHFHKSNKSPYTQTQQILYHKPILSLFKFIKNPKEYNRLNPDKERVRWESEEGEGFQINLETHVMAPAAVSCHLTTLLNLTLKLTPTLTTSTSKWFSAIAMAAMRTKKLKLKSRLPRSKLRHGSKMREPRRGSKPKSNKHLWEQISSKMREKGFDRSPTMCTD